MGALLFSSVRSGVLVKQARGNIRTAKLHTDLMALNHERFIISSQGEWRELGKVQEELSVAFW